MQFDFFNILYKSLSTESQFFLVALLQHKEPLNKEQLWELANELYIQREIKRGRENVSKLIPSRYSLDIHTSRLEGAGLVDVKEIGRMRMYSITKLGEALLNYARQQNN